MTVVISDVLPNPIGVHSGETVQLAVTMTSFQAYDSCRLRIKNHKPPAADLFDSDESATDIIVSDEFALHPGANHHSHVVGFKLSDSTEQAGAVIGLSVTVVQGSDEISPPKKILANIAAV